MSSRVQDFLAENILVVKKDLVKAYLILPEDKRNWSPAPSARTAANMTAECALNNGFTNDVIQAKKWPGNDQAAHFEEREQLAQGDWETLSKLLDENTERVAETIKNLRDSDLDVTVQTPYGTGPLSGIAAYPYWNMQYHLGQINYLHAILGIEEKWG